MTVLVMLVRRGVRSVAISEVGTLAKGKEGSGKLKVRLRKLGYLSVSLA